MIKNYEAKNLILVIIGFFSILISPVISLFVNLALLYYIPCKEKK